MRRLLSLTWLALAAATLAGAAPAGSARDPASYRVRLAVRPVGGASVQRLAIPAEILVASETPDLADVRVFDARGRAMPIARAPASPPPPRRDALRPLPIVGADDALDITGLSLQLDAAGQARVARIDGSVRRDAGGSVLLGALFDARAITGAARNLALDAALPAAQPITFTIAASPDLKDWRTIAEQVVYRAPEGGDRPVAVSLGGAALAHDYLRLTWRGATRLLSPVTIHGATLLTSGGDAATTTVDATLPKGSGGAAIDLALRFATPLATIRIVPGGDDVIVPVRVLGRDDREQPWTPLGEGIATRVAAGRDIVLTGGAFRLLRIEAERPAASFTATPAIRLGFAPRAILFVAAGQPPYTLAAGQAGAADPYLPSATIAAEANSPPPDAQLATAERFVVPLDLAGDAAGRRRTILWAILALATALLAAMAWRLSRRAADPRGG